MIVRFIVVALFLVFCGSIVGLPQQTTPAKFLRVIDRLRVPLDPVIRQLPETRGLNAVHFTIATELTERAPGLLVKKAGSSGRRPVVILLHGTGGNKEGLSNELAALANKGFIAVAIDGRYHGERAPGEDYPEAILRAYINGDEHPFLYDTVWDVLRLVDYLETRDDVDPKRIGLMGFSKGGMETYLAAAADPRIAVAAPCIGVQSFRWALENNAWKDRIETIYPAVEQAAEREGARLDASFVRKFYDRVVPGIYSEFDGPAMLPLIAPRPLLVINGELDSLTPREGVLQAADAAAAAYKKAGKPEQFMLQMQKNIGHEVAAPALQEAFDWFVRWLKP